MKEYYIINVHCYPSYEEKRETYLDNDGNYTHFKNKAKRFNSYNDAFNYIYDKKYIGLIYSLGKINNEST